MGMFGASRRRRSANTYVFFFAALVLSAFRRSNTLYFDGILMVRAQDMPFHPSRRLPDRFDGGYFLTHPAGSVGGDIIKAAFLAAAKSADRRASPRPGTASSPCGPSLVVADVGTIFW